VNVDGECHCGKIRFTARVNPEWVFVCHCADCQALSGSAFRAGVAVSDDSFKLMSGDPKVYKFKADSGIERVRAFCPDCGTPIYAADARDLRYLMIPITTTKQKHELRPQMQLWCRSALSWVEGLKEIEGTTTQPVMPR
jgi:hypothetical protein